jgi:hypothetical protein
LKATSNEATLAQREGKPQTFSRLREALLYVFILASSFAIYTSNAQTLSSYDSAPNSVLAFNLIQNHRLDLDLFRGSYFTALGGQYAFNEAPNGHLTSAYPIGAALVSLPIYVAFYVTARAGGGFPAINTPAFEPFRQRYEKTAAAVIAALSVGLFFACAREIGNAAQAGIATVTYALATSMWSTGSQALWQHGPVDLFVLGMTYAIFRAVRAREHATGPFSWTAATRWLIYAGLCAGFLPVIRPTAVLFSIAALVFVGWTFRARSLVFGVALATGLTPGIAWNAYFFHSLIGGYAGIAHPYAVTPPHALMAFAGLLVSPSRGLFTFSPVLLYSMVGAGRAWRVRDSRAVLVVVLATACAVLVLQYAFFRYWWAGYVYGPRFLTDVAAIAALALVYVIPPHPLAFVRSNVGAAAAAAGFGLLLFFSVAVQFVGLNSGAAGSEWNAVPISVDRDPERVWPLRDNQIERNARAAYFRFFAWNIAAAPAYARGVGLRVTAVSPALSDVVHGSSIDATAAVRNEGSSRLYGYDSGVYVGQMRVAVRIVDAKQQLSSEQYLYLRGNPGSGENAHAVGTLTMPQTPGTYELRCQPVLVGGAALDDRGAPFRLIVHAI